MDFKNINKDIGELQNKIDKKKKELKDIIYDLLSNIIGAEYEDIENLKKNFILWENLENNEFSFNYPFGNISFDDLIKINDGFYKEGFKIGAIISNDIYENKKGLEITFTKIDGD